MTDEEKQAIISEVLKSLETNSVTVEQLTATTSLADTDSIEVSGGRRVTYATLIELIKAAIADLLNDYGGSVSGKSLKSATATATASEVAITITNVDGKAVTASVPVASTSSAGVLTAADYSKIAVIDAKPTAGSVHPVQSGGVKSALDSVPIVDAMNLLGLSTATTLQDVLNATTGNQYAWLRTSGRVLSVLTGDGWKSYQFVGEDFSDWSDARKWKGFGSGEKGDPGTDAVVYRLLPGALVYKADTTAVSLSLLKTEGESTAVAALPAGWVVQVTWDAAGGLTKNATLSTLAAVNPNSLPGATSVELTLYTGNPEASGGNAQVVDSATLLLVADGKKGDKGDKGDKGEKGDKGADGSGAGSLVLHPFDDLKHFRLSAMDYETGIATLQATPSGVSVGDFVAIAYDVADAISIYNRLPDRESTSVPSNSSNGGAIIYGYITAISGTSVTTSLIYAGKGTLATPTNYMLVCFGANEPTDDLQITLPSGFQGKPIKVELWGQAMNKPNQWDIWSVKAGSQSALVDVGGDNGHGIYVHEVYEFNGQTVGYTDLAYATGASTAGSYRQKEILIKMNYNVEEMTKVVVPWQFGMYGNVVIISLL